MAKSKKSSNPRRDWIVRILIFGTLGVGLVLALMDYQTKRQATQTGEAWRDLLRDKNADDADLYQAELEAAVVGTPEITANESRRETAYLWPGVFRDYQITVRYDRAVKPSVSEIIGPGEDAEPVAAE